MSQPAFKIVTLSDMYIQVKPAFARAKVEILLDNKNLNATSLVGLDLVFTYNDADTIQSVHQKIAAETSLALREALALCDGCSLSELKAKTISGPELAKD
jgi:hypothetical protein